MSILLDNMCIPTLFDNSGLPALFISPYVNPSIWVQHEPLSSTSCHLRG